MRPGDAFYGPPLAIPIGEGIRGYEDPETREVLPGVTSILKVLPKPALEGWAARETARAAFEHRRAIAGMNDGEAVVDMLKNARYRNMNRAGDVGSLVHRAIAALGGHGEMPTEISARAQAIIDQALAFVELFRPTFTVLEGTVFNRTSAYAGTFDFLAEIDGLLILGDWKTGSGIYREVALQLAALRYAELLWDPATGDLVPMPEVAGCIAVHLQPDGYRVHEIRADESAYAAFVAARELFPFAVAGGDARCIGPTLSPTRLSRTFSPAVRPA